MAPRLVLFSLLVLVAAGIAHAAGDYPLAGRHELGLQVGMWSNSSSVRTEVSAGSVSSEVGNGGGMAGVAYTHWMREGLAMQVSLSGMVADVSSKVEGGEISSVTATAAPLLFGLKYYFPASTYGGKVRPFASGLVGPIIGTQSSTEVSSVVIAESRTEMAVGAQLGAGFDFVIGRHFLAGISVGLNIMTDFEEPIGGRENFNGGAFRIEFGYLF